MSVTKWFNTDLLKESVAITDYLTSKGFEPAKTVGVQLVYFSPLTEENTPSFFVDPRQNVFSCFASHEKGDIIRLVRLLENVGFNDACKILENFQGNFSQTPKRQPKQLVEESRTTIRRIADLSTPALIRYVEGRKIPISLARKYLSEVHYTVKRGNEQTNFYAVGFKNNTGGYELRTAQFKGCTGIKDIRFVEGKDSLSSGCRVLIIFEGFFDFLSFLTHKRLTQTPYDTIILNSTTQLFRAMPIIEKYGSIVCYFDNDASGQKTYAKLVELTQIPALNASAKYFPNSKDYNDFLCQTKQP
jgi:hypothetical protein